MKYNDRVRIKDHSVFFNGSVGRLVNQNIYLGDVGSELTFDVMLDDQVVVEIPSNNLEKI